MSYPHVVYRPAAAPQMLAPDTQVILSEQTMQQRLQNVLAAMAQKDLDVLIVYADREHGGNFAYLTGWEPRFEEALLVLHQNGRAYQLLGNEMFSMGKNSRLNASCILVPYFSLPNQPMENTKPLHELFRDAGLETGQRVGLAGWKMFTDSFMDNSRLFDLPYYIVNTIMEIAGSHVVNACDLFISPEGGVRTTVNANEAAHFEYFACLASNGILRAMQQVAVGKTETEIASFLESEGQQHSVHTICATGERFTNAIVPPRDKAVVLGDRFSMSIGYKGGFSNRGGFAVSSADELNPAVSDYLEKVAKPYYAGLAVWYSTLKVGLSGGELYAAVDSVLPKKEFGWSLNPGHLIGTEEWLSSPIEKDSLIRLRSGMMLQADIIISVPGYSGINGEDGVLLADEALQAAIRAEYPALWARFMQRRAHIMDAYHIALHPSVLPMSNTCGYVNPFFLNRTHSLALI